MGLTNGTRIPEDSSSRIADSRNRSRIHAEVETPANFAACSNAAFSSEDSLNRIFSFFAIEFVYPLEMHLSINRLVIYHIDIQMAYEQARHQDRAQILHMLCEGQSIRAITRITGMNKNNVRDVAAKRVRVDEIWCSAYANQKNVATAKAAPEGAGEMWTWTAIDADSKMVLSYFVGGRDGQCAMWFIDDLRTRLAATRVQLTSDGHIAYLEAVEGAFGADIDYAMLVKIYGLSPDSFKTRYSPAECTGIKDPYRR